MEQTAHYVTGWENINQTITEFKPSEKSSHKSNKEKGKVATVEHYTVEDYGKMLNYFKSLNNKKGNGMLHYLMLVLQTNTARRNSDMITLRWKDLFNPSTGKFWDHVEMTEKKTGKYAAPLINNAIRKEINDFLEITGVDPSENNYENFIFTQYTGAHKGEVISYNACYRAVKRAAEKLGIQYDVGTHSARKFFGATMYELHGNEYDSKTILSEIFNHSDEKITNRYIGVTRKRKDEYHEDMGELFEQIKDGTVGNGTAGILMERYVRSDLNALVVEAFMTGMAAADLSESERVNQIAGLISKLETLAR